MPTGVYKKTAEHKRKLGEALKGRHRSEETTRKMVETRKRRPTWNKRKQRKHWSEETRRKISEALKERALKGQGQVPWNKGKTGIYSEERKEKMREWAILHPNKIFKDTSIELKMEAELKKRGVYYQKQVPLCKVARVDFYLPEYRIVIQCDGDYWHNLPDHKERDVMQDRILTFNGFNVYRFWEHEINESVENCVNKVFD